MISHCTYLSKKSAFIVAIIWVSLSAQPSTPGRTITDKAGLTSVRVNRIVCPANVKELQKLVQDSSGPLSIAGSRYSQGGHIAYPEGLVIDMSRLSNIISLDTEKKSLTVEAGATWRSVLNYIDRYNLSVKVMQSYEDFSVGGSLSVNVHARDINYGTMISTVESLTILLANGQIVKANRSENADLFYAAIGGYGLFGIIITATLSLTDNVRLRREIKPIDSFDYSRIFLKVQQDSHTVFQNADLYPPNFLKGSSITWRKSAESLTTSHRLQGDVHNEAPLKGLEKMVGKHSFLHKARPFLSRASEFTDKVVLRNYEMSHSVKHLTISRNHTTSKTLQEYFVPMNRYHNALEAITKTLTHYNVNVLNLSVRFVPKDSEPILSYARQDSFAFVLYISVPNSLEGKKELNRWTRRLVTKILALNGTYYLPYALSASREQFYKAYPRYQHFRELKDLYDPHHRFRNMLWKNYFE